MEHMVEVQPGPGRLAAILEDILAVAAIFLGLFFPVSQGPNSAAEAAPEA